MERSDPHDAWDAWDAWANDGDGDGDGDRHRDLSYPPAPLPAHERTWRHPSEMGNAVWERSEPPVAIGRNLLVTTGGIGSVLGIAALWLLSPLGGELAPSSSPTVAFPSAASSIQASTRIDTSTLMGDQPTVILPAEEVPSTVLVAAPSSHDRAAIAVAVAGQPYMVTTAAAVGHDFIGVNDDNDTDNDNDHDNDNEIDVIAPGNAIRASIMSIEGDLAFIEPSRSVEVIRFGTVSVAHAGQTVLVLTVEPTEVAYAVDGGVGGLDASRIVEGTPVIDADGALVALCTVVIDAEGAWVDMVPVVLPTGTTGTTVSVKLGADAPSR